MARLPSTGLARCRNFESWRERRKKLLELRFLYLKGGINSVRKYTWFVLFLKIHIDFPSPVPFPKSYQDWPSLFIIQYLRTYYVLCSMQAIYIHHLYSSSHQHHNMVLLSLLHIKITDAQQGYTLTQDCTVKMC